MKIQSLHNHKSVVITDNYHEIDGRHTGHSDAKGLSLGLTTGNGRGKAELSARIWRCTDQKWSEQSEEMPLHRVLDLSILICRSLEYFQEAYIYEHLYNPEKPAIDRIGIQGGAMNVSICTENEKIREDIRLFHQALSDDGEMIGERLRTLSGILKELGY
ncbi:DUF6530 family protein [Paenibacillus sp. GD4]|jgi:hypothetical protein|uniref:DUF6530 family protein n=1 Tax=Paenibacillus sp. GD4 TaxID=3068890 RepID=UPI002796528D|nr:DUF6530 family protein [Paenibacillus sp. GD4]MDQ1913798.1 DUF6530 family protein [Paenibacillus sp. GD4]